MQLFQIKIFKTIYLLINVFSGVWMLSNSDLSKRMKSYCAGTGT